MSKMKGHKGSVKRFKVTGTGKLRRRQQGLRHINSHFTGDRQRRLRRPVAGDTAICKRYVRTLEER